MSTATIDHRAVGRPGAGIDIKTRTVDVIIGWHQTGNFCGLIAIAAVHPVLIDFLQANNIGTPDDVAGTSQIDKAVHALAKLDVVTDDTHRLIEP